MSRFLAAVWPRRGHAATVAAAFGVVLYAGELVAFRDAYYSQSLGINYLEGLLRSVSWKWLVSQAVLVPGSVAVFIAYLYAALIAAPGWKAVHGLVFAVACLVEYSTQASLGRPSDASDVRQFLLVNDISTVARGGALFLSAAALWPVAALMALLVLFRRERVAGGWWRFLATTGLMVAMFAAAASLPPWFLLYRNYLKYPAPAFTTFFRSLTEYAYAAADAFGVPRDAVAAQATPPPVDNVLFIVDESVRGDHLSLNGYARDTTPYLNELERRGVLQNWGLASSLATCSDAAHALLLTGLRPEDLPATYDALRRAPTIFQYARAHGYRTHYLDASMTQLWSLTTYDLPFLDSWQGAASFAPSPDTDVAVAQRVRAIVEGSRGNFIWVTKIGAHTDYDARFPATAAEWRPFTVGNDYSGGAAAMANAYDNALKYNLEGFFRALVPDGRPPDGTRILYTSDHGESILADLSRNPPHCRQAREQAIVPLFLMGFDRPVDTGFRAGHVNVFATLLDLLGVPVEARRRAHGPSLLTARAADSRPRVYIGASFTTPERLRFD